MPTHGRHAYAALLLVTGLEQLQFNPLLRQQKRKWNSSQTRYVSFYNAKDPVARLAAAAFDWRPVEHLRLLQILHALHELWKERLALSEEMCSVTIVIGFALLTNPGTA